MDRVERCVTLKCDSCESSFQPACNLKVLNTFLEICGLRVRILALSLDGLFFFGGGGGGEIGSSFIRFLFYGHGVVFITVNHLFTCYSMTCRSRFQLILRHFERVI